MRDGSTASGATRTTIVVGDHDYVLCLPHDDVDTTQLKLASTRRPFEEGLLEAMTESLAADDLVLDVGACVGNHTIYLAVVAGCRVVAYEPNQALAEALRSSVRANGLDDKVTVRDVAVGSASGRGQLTGPGDARDLAAGSVTVVDGAEAGAGDVAVVALDDERLPGRVAALKIDVNGTELAVLQGARVLIERDRPLLVVQCGELDGFRKVRDLTDELGYSLVATHHTPPCLVFRPSSEGEVDGRLVASLVTATEQLYVLRSATSALRADLRARAREDTRVTREHAERQDRAREETEELRAALSQARADTEQARGDADQARDDGDRARRSLEEADEARRAVAAQLSRAAEQLAGARQALKRARAQRDALRRRRAVRWANMLGAVKRRFRSS